MHADFPTAFGNLGAILESEQDNDVMSEPTVRFDAWQRQAGLHGAGLQFHDEKKRKVNKHKFIKLDW